MTAISKLRGTKMSNKLRLNDIQKYHHEYVIAISDNGVELRAVCDFAANKIVYNVKCGNIVDIMCSLNEAVELYNKLLD
jgi:hypothetical protein